MLILRLIIDITRNYEKVVGWVERSETQHQHEFCWATIGLLNLINFNK